MYYLFVWVKNMQAGTPALPGKNVLVFGRGLLFPAQL